MKISGRAAVAEKEGDGVTATSSPPASKSTSKLLLYSAVCLILWLLCKMFKCLAVAVTVGLKLRAEYSGFRRVDHGKIGIAVFIHGELLNGADRFRIGVAGRFGQR